MKKILILLLFFPAWFSGAQTALILPELEAIYRDAKKNGNAKAIADAAVPVGKMHLELRNYKRSTDYLLVAKNIYKSQNDVKNLAKVCGLLAQNYYKTGNNKRYNDYIALGEQLVGNDTLSPVYLSLLDTRIGYYKARKKAKQAQYLESRKAQLLAQLHAPKLVAEKPAPAKTTPAIQSKAKPGAAKTDTKIVSEPPKSDPKKTTQTAIPAVHIDNVLLLSVSIGVFSFAGLIFFVYRDHRRKVIYRINTDVLQSKLLANISKTIAETSANTAYNQALAGQLSQLSKLKADDVLPVFEQENVGQIIQSAAVPFMQHAAMHRISVVSNLEQKNEKQTVDKTTLETICNILFSDAIQHTQAGDSVYFSVTTERNNLHLRLSYPRGPMSKKEAKNLLDGLYATNGNSLNAVGFALIKASVEWLGGKAETALDGNLLRVVIKMPLTGETARAPKQVPAVVL